MFHWADSLGIMEPIARLRSHVHFSNGYLPYWAIYSLPFALWVLSYLFLVNSIWGESTSFWRVVYSWIIPIIAITAELAQGFRILPGRFDLVDLVAVILATILGFVATDLGQNKKE